MNNLEKLMADHAYWSGERKRLKQEGSEEYSKCERANRPESGHIQTCIEAAYADTRDCANEYGQLGDGDYEVVLEDSGACSHCLKTRELKRQRMIAGRRLGAVRSAITRIGNRLLKEQVQQ